MYKYLSTGDWGSAFFGKKSNYYTIPEDLTTLTTIKKYAFENAQNIQTIEISKYVTTIEVPMTNEVMEFSYSVKDKDVNFPFLAIDLTPIIKFLAFILGAVYGI